MTVVVGGLRALDGNAVRSAQGVLTRQPGELPHGLSFNLLEVSAFGPPVLDRALVLEGHDRSTRQIRWTRTQADLVFGFSLATSCDGARSTLRITAANSLWLTLLRPGQR